jgi:hypothetical protein
MGEKCRLKSQGEYVDLRERRLTRDGRKEHDEMLHDPSTNILMKIFGI